MGNKTTLNLTINNDLNKLIAAVITEVIAYYQIQTTTEQVNELSNIITNSKNVQNAMINMISFEKNKNIK